VFILWYEMAQAAVSESPNSRM